MDYLISNNSMYHDYLSMVVKNGLYFSMRNLNFHLQNLLGDINFVGKNVLDIGSGSGLYGFYAAVKGANTVVCLEPEMDGSKKGTSDKFNILKSKFGYHNIILESKTLQDYCPIDHNFDVIFLLNSINHLDEQACIDLLLRDSAQVSYEKLFTKINLISSQKAILIVSDCSPINFFSLLGFKNPFAPTIEWHKHQAPEVWIRFLTKAGFGSPVIRWSSFNSLGKIGKLIIGNKSTAFFFLSHFYFMMQKV